jgi:hypothetical protein
MDSKAVVSLVQCDMERVDKLVNRRLHRERAGLGMGTFDDDASLGFASGLLELVEDALRLSLAYWSILPNEDERRWYVPFWVHVEGVAAAVAFGQFNGPPGEDGAVEIGYAVAPQFRAQGIRTPLLLRRFDETSLALNYRHWHRNCARSLPPCSPAFGASSPCVN